MNIVLLTNAQPNQVALVNKIYLKNQNISIILRTSVNEPISAKNIFSLNKIYLSVFSLGAIFAYKKVWSKLQRYFDLRYSSFPIDPLFEVDDINDPRVALEIQKIKPDLVIISGTNILKIKLIEEIELTGKIMNLHTGISPYVKGGPNCTNWCLFNKEFSFIGNTVMWLDSGIDSGNIIATEQTSLNGQESLYDLHVKVLEHAHDLYLRAIQDFMNGKILPNISQESIEEGTLHLSKDWTPGKIFISCFNFYFFYRQGIVTSNKKIGSISLVNLSR